MKVFREISIRGLIYLIIASTYFSFMAYFAPLGIDWLPFHSERIYNFSQYLKLHGYFENYGFSIWDSKCENCFSKLNTSPKDIYLSISIFSNFLYVIVNHLFEKDVFILIGNIIDKILILSSGILISELFIKFSRDDLSFKYIKGILIFTLFLINPWTYKMFLGQWVIVYFIFFFLIGTFCLTYKKYLFSFLFFFIAGLFDYQSSLGIVTFYIFVIMILILKKEKNLINEYFFIKTKNEFLKYKIIFAYLTPIILYFVLRSNAYSQLGFSGGSSILERIGISGNDIYNGGILGAFQFLAGNRLSVCLIGNNYSFDSNNLLNTVFIYNCFLSLSSMLIISLIALFGTLYSIEKKNYFFKVIILPVLFLLLSYVFILQQSLSVHLMGYSYFFSLIFSFGISNLIFKILKKNNFKIFYLLFSFPIIIGIVITCIRVNMLTGVNG